MGAKSTTLQENVINYILGQNAYTPPTDVFFALFTEEFDEGVTPIDATFVLSDEVDSGTTTYERVQVANDNVTWDGSMGQRTLQIPVVFPTAGESWSTIKAVAVMDQCSGGNGSDILFYKNLSVFKAVTTGDTVTISAGSLIFNED